MHTRSATCWLCPSTSATERSRPRSSWTRIWTSSHMEARWHLPRRSARLAWTSPIQGSGTPGWTSLEAWSGRWRSWPARPADQLSEAASRDRPHQPHRERDDQERHGDEERSLDRLERPEAVRRLVDSPAQVPVLLEPAARTEARVKRLTSEAIDLVGRQVMAWGVLQPAVYHLAATGQNCVLDGR